MGNRPARPQSPRKEFYPSERSRLPPSTKSFSTHHLDTHYNTMNQVLNQHLSHVSSQFGQTTDQQMTVRMHGNALNLALQHHLNATQRQKTMSPQAHHLIYTF